MKICIPTMDKSGLNAMISDHFGKAPVFTFIDTETNVIEAFSNESDHNGGTGSPPDHIAKHGAEIVLASGAGGKAISMLNDHGIKVYIGNHGTVKEILEKWKTGTLTEAGSESGCKHHDDHHHH
jgi:predicted Fe-Mo cluster-binding NifX family protein